MVTVPQMQLKFCLRYWLGKVSTQGPSIPNFCNADPFHSTHIQLPKLEYRCADKSSARPGRTQATATDFVYS